MDKNEKLIKDAQYRKGLSIAFFNSTNAAIELAKVNGMVGVLDPKKFITEWRDFFLEEHRNYYANTIANVGMVYDVKATVEKLNNVKSLDELKAIWLSLSEDERRDGEILKVKDTLKKSFKK